MLRRISNQRRFVRDLLIAFGCACLLATNASAQTTAFTYQGRLTDSGTPANGNYDLQFALWDSSAGGSQIGVTQLLPAVQVSSGVFTVTFDFGANAFPGASRFLEISARLSGASAFILLTPRQQITSTPYAVRSANATAADTATNATQLGGLGAGQYVQTNDARLTDSRAPTTGSANYIQNTTSTQASSNFNISGDGTASGMLSGNVVNATTQYNLNGTRVLSPGPVGVAGDLMVGANSGTALTTGINNSFFGVSAGNSTTTGGGNSFFGFRAGLSNTTPTNNSFFGNSAGLSNTTGNGNSFFGGNVGFQNTTGSNNSFFGAAAGFGNSTGGDNSFFGTEAGISNTVGSSNSFFGTGAGRANTFAPLNSFFGAHAGFANTASSNSFFGSFAGAANTTGSANSFFGNNAGVSNLIGTDNSIFGAAAGQSTTSSFNSFFGSFAGGLNTTGAFNSIFGAYAGPANVGGDNNAFFGYHAALGNTSGSGNAFFGAYTGQGNIGGVDNVFFGRSAGFSSNADNNSFFGTLAGFLNQNGNNNTFLGYHAGEANGNGAGNVVIGARANVGGGNFNNATAIGALAEVDCSNCLILGSINGVNTATADTSVGIGTTVPAAKLHVSGGSMLLDNNQGFFFKSTAGTLKRVLLADSINTLHIGSGGGLGFDQIRFDLGTPGTVMTMLSNGNVGVGTTAPDQVLSVNGNASKVGGGSWQVFSDERLKNIKGRFSSGLQTLRQLQPLRYEYKPNNALGLRGEGEYVGFSAQAVERVLPEAVSRTASGYLQINNDPILWTMLNAIKEQQSEIEKLQRELHNLRNVKSEQAARSRQQSARRLRRH